MMWRPTGVEPDRHGHHSTLDTVSHHNSRLSGMPTLRYGLLAFSYSLTLCRVTACGTSLSLLRTSRAAAIHGYGALALAQAVGFEPTGLSAFCFQDRCHRPLDHACIYIAVRPLRAHGTLPFNVAFVERQPNRAVVFSWRDKTTRTTPTLTKS